MWSVRISLGTLVIMTEISYDFPQSLQANAGILSHSVTTSFQILSNLFLESRPAFRRYVVWLRPELEADCSPPSRAEAKNGGSIPPFIRLLGVVLNYLSTETALLYLTPIVIVISCSVRNCNRQKLFLVEHISAPLMIQTYRIMSDLRFSR
jgi:hypothetical protein